MSTTAQIDAAVGKNLTTPIRCFTLPLHILIRCVDHLTDFTLNSIRFSRPDAARLLSSPLGLPDHSYGFKRNTGRRRLDLAPAGELRATARAVTNGSRGRRGN